jgi:hypothetical protein
MNNFEENAIKIANYLEDKMSPAEEEAFMQELGTDEELRQQYEEELLVSSLLQNKEEAAVGSTDLLLQSADEHINMIEKVLERKAIHKNEAPVIPMFSFYKKIAAAAVVVIIAGSVFFILQKKNNNQPVTAAKTFIEKDSGTKSDSIIKFMQPQAEEITKAHSPGDSNRKINSTVKIQSRKPAQVIEKNTPNDNSKADSITARRSRSEQIAKALMLEDSIAKINSTAKIQSQKHSQVIEEYTPKDNTKTDSSGKVQPLLPADNAIAQSAFKNFYTRYSNGEKDPVEISDYYKSYTEGNYTKVLSATDADYQLMGTGERNNLLKQYMQLYKGLAYLAENKPADAIQKFDLVLQSSLKTAPQYYEAQWYSALAWLKINDSNKAAAIAKDIIQTASVHSKLSEGFISKRQVELPPNASTYRLKAIQLLNALHVK